MSMGMKITFPLDMTLVEETDKGFVIEGSFFDFGEEFYDKFGKVYKVYLDKKYVIQEIELVNGERLIVEWEI